MKHLFITLVIIFTSLNYVYAQSDTNIDINTASAKSLASLPGIGEKKAQNIIEYRQNNGCFTSKEQLKNIKGIGDVIYAKVKNMIAVSDTTEC